MRAVSASIPTPEFGRFLRPQLPRRASQIVLDELVEDLRLRDLDARLCEPGSGLCWLALEGVKNPGDLGTALRSAEADGAPGLILIRPETAPFQPDVQCPDFDR